MAAINSWLRSLVPRRVGSGHETTGYVLYTVTAIHSFRWYHSIQDVYTQKIYYHDSLAN